MGCFDEKGQLSCRKKEIAPKDLYDKPIIVSRQADKTGIVKRLLGRPVGKFNIVGTYNLLYNGTLMVQDGLGYALCIESVFNPSHHNELCFKPLTNALIEEMRLIWKKDNVFSKSSQKFFEAFSK